MVKFIRGTASQFDKLAVKVEDTIYFLTDTDELYIGEHKVTSKSELAAAIIRIQTNEQNIASLTAQLEALTNGEEGSISDMIQDAVDSIEAQIGNLEDLEELESTTIVDALNELKELIDALDEKADQIKTDSVVTIESAAGDDETVAKKYTVKQGGNTVGTINIPRDLVVESGEYNTETHDKLVGFGW